MGAGDRDEKNKKFFENLNIKTTNKKDKKAINDNSEMTELKKLLLDPELLKDAIEWSWDNYPKIWNDLGKKCLTCGICAYVCPLCHCFSIEDRISLSGKNCMQCRKWDACTLPNFSRIAGGYKFHKTTKERYYNWFYHKFVRGYYEFGESQCVACGRCKKYCPAGSNIEEIILNILGKPESLITMVQDRPGNDLRYSIDTAKITSELGWQPRQPFEEGIFKTIQWYEHNIDWVERIRERDKEFSKYI